MLRSSKEFLLRMQTVPRAYKQACRRSVGFPLHGSQTLIPFRVAIKNIYKNTYNIYNKLGSFELFVHLINFMIGLVSFDFNDVMIIFVLIFLIIF